MELTTSSVTGSLRLVLQVVSSQKRPVLEIYHEIRNRSGPPTEYEVPRGPGGKTAKTTHRHQEIFLQLFLVNIGGERAEDVSLELSGDFDYLSGLKRLSEIAILNGTSIPQLAPAEYLHICRIDESDLWTQGETGKKVVPKPAVTINVRYNGANRGLNRFRRAVNRVRRRQFQFESTFVFNPATFSGRDLPAMEYT